MPASAIVGRRIRLRGIVQGVGMRPWIYRLAHEHGVTGRVCNGSAGVTIDAFGPDGSVNAFTEALGRKAPPAAAIHTLETCELAPEPAASFVIVESEAGEDRHVSIPPDLATCEDCAAEIFDPRDRRYRYPFTNCTNCGPRFTIATDVPYDRGATTMARFRMCAACQAEYDDPADRRFHAQPNACPACGPQLQALDADGQPIRVQDPIAFAARQVLDGRIVAIKGLGGFHLACDATAPAAVMRLRERKHRDEKPFAVMTRTMDDVRRFCHVSPAARMLLSGAERPIVLLPRRRRERGASDDGAVPCEEVAPRNPLLGVVLPYTPLHHLLLDACDRPLVMTSANVSEEPIVYRDDEAVRRLSGIADAILLHDREIVTRCDDSVATLVNGGPLLLRRSRGYVPRAIRLPFAVDRPILATGALLKNTFCLACGHEAWPGPHIGDLENAETFTAFEEAIDRMERFLGFRGDVVAHDLHPEYLSTRYALTRESEHRVAVQHHHAHIASAMAEHALAGPVLGIAFDGTGYGTDGTAWGGEFLLVDGAAYERVATLRPVRLPGADAAIRHPWRIALGALIDAYGDDAPVDALPLFNQVAPREVAIVRQMLAAGLNAPAARGAGRYFDAVGALVLGRRDSRYEGQVAFELNMAADPEEPGAYEFALDDQRTPLELDLRPTVRAVVGDLLAGIAAGTVSARFHNTLTRAAATVVRRVLRVSGRLPVVLSGGCFQNVRLAEGLLSELGTEFTVYVHRQVPPGDGGIALGQAFIAAQRDR